MPRRAPPAETFAYTVTAPLETRGAAGFLTVWLPAALQREAPFARGEKLRIRGTLNGAPVARAWQVAGGRHFLHVGTDLADAVGITPGAEVTLRFSIVDEDDVALPAELREALRQEPSWRAPWRALTPGQRRGLAYRVDSARGPETRARRAVEVLEAVAAGLPVGRPRRR